MGFKKGSVTKSTTKVYGVDQDMVNAHRLVKVSMQADHAVCVARVDMPEYDIKAGERFELVASSYVGYAYIIKNDAQGNRSCTCKRYEFMHTCKHCRQCSDYAVARYFARKAESEHEMVLELIMREDDVVVHVEDDLRQESRLGAYEGFSLLR